MFMTSIRARYVGVLLMLGIVCEISILYKPTLMWIKNNWLSYTPDRLGMSVPILFSLIGAYKLIKQPPNNIQTDIKGLVLLLLSLCTLFVGILADIHVIQAVSFILFGFGFMVYWGGIDLGKRFFFLFAFLILMIPSISFLFESLAGVQLRKAIAISSGLLLILTGGSWANGVDGLLFKDIVVPVQYYRDSLSSPLPLLILTCVIAELVFKKNRHKFAFTSLFGLLFVLAHGVFIAIMGWSIEYDFDHLIETLWNHQRWMPASIYAVLLGMATLVIKALGSRQFLMKRWYGGSKGRDTDDQ